MILLCYFLIWCVPTGVLVLSNLRCYMAVYIDVCSSKESFEG